MALNHLLNPIRQGREVVGAMEGVLHAKGTEANMTFTPFVAVWSVLAVVVIGLAIYRKMISASEDDSIHVSEGGARVISEQAALSHRLDVIDKWGKLLTVIVVAIGLLLAGIYFYGVWQSGVTQVH